MPTYMVFEVQVDDEGEPKSALPISFIQTENTLTYTSTPDPLTREQIAKKCNYSILTNMDGILIKLYRAGLTEDGLYLLVPTEPVEI